MTALGLALGAVVGLSLGLLGGGGSILTVPIFVYVLGFDAKAAIAMSLPVVGVTSLVGAINHWRAGNTSLRTAAVFGATAMAGAYGGAHLARFLSGSAQLFALAVVMLAAAVAMLRGPVTSAPDTTAPPATAKLLLVGLATGMLTGIVGIGGGFLIVPALVLLARLPMKQAVGTSLLVIAMNAAAVAGILAGTSLVRFVPQAALKRGFAVFLILVSALILFQNRSLFTG